MTDQKKYIFISILMSTTFFLVRTIPLPIIIYKGIIYEGFIKLTQKEYVFGIFQILGVTILRYIVI
jgi:hypothetical protein